MEYFTETEESCICESCKKEFKAYNYYEDCPNCHDGTMDNGNRCFACGGGGDYEEVVKDKCQRCLYLYLIDD